MILNVIFLELENCQWLNKNSFVTILHKRKKKLQKREFLTIEIIIYNMITKTRQI